MTISQKLQAARYALISTRPYIAALLWALKPKPSAQCPDMAIGRDGSLYYNEEFINKLETEQAAMLLYHNVQHVLREHAERMVGLAPAEIVALATDMEINDDLHKEGFRLTENMVLPDVFGLKWGLTAEEYHKLLSDIVNGAIKCAKMTGGQQQQQNQSHGQSSLIQETLKRISYRQQLSEVPEHGSSVLAKPAPWEEEDNAESGPDENLENAKNRVATAIINTAAEKPGTVPGYLIRIAKDIIHGRRDWRRDLLVATKAIAADLSGRVDYTYRRPSRRQSIYQDIVMPSLRLPKSEVAIVVDVSGSISHDMLRRLLGETERILRTIGPSTVLMVDTEVHYKARLHSVKGLKFIGGGGTDMGVGIEEAAKSSPRPAVIVVLTDGATPWPEEPPPGIKVIVTALPDRMPTVPAWARAIEIQEEEKWRGR